MKNKFGKIAATLGCLVLACAAYILLAPPPRASAHAALPIPTVPEPQPQGGAVITCASDNGRRNFCAADTRGGVQLVRQRSDAACIFDRTWGFDARNIWVDRGCGGDFQDTYVGPGLPNFPGYAAEGGAYGIYCASDNGQRNFCPTDTSGGVSLARQRSNTLCNYGTSWGYDRRGVWVDRGCRADFRIGGNGWQPPTSPGVTVVTCGSLDNQRNTCKVDGSGGVRLIRQRSAADCIYNHTWGLDPELCLGGSRVPRGF
jgi:DUF3011 family protein